MYISTAKSFEKAKTSELVYPSNLKSQSTNKAKPHKPLGCGVSWLLLLDLNQWHQTLSHALLRVVHSTQKKFFIS